MSKKLEKHVVISKFRGKWTLHGKFLYFHLALAKQDTLQANIAEAVFDRSKSLLNRWLTGTLEFKEEKLDEAAFFVATAGTETNSATEFKAAYWALEKAYLDGKLVDDNCSVVDLPKLAKAFLRDYGFIGANGDPTDALGSWEVELKRIKKRSASAPKLRSKEQVVLPEAISGCDPISRPNYITVEQAFTENQHSAAI